jgi:HAD superfamily hydrolase (TIGR01450 family)
VSRDLIQELAPEALPALKGFLFDLDGTLLLSDRSLGGYEVLPGAIEVLSALSARAIPFVVLTNGSAYPPAEQAARLRELGLPVADERMLTPSSVAADLMSRNAVKRVLVLGARGVGHALSEAGIATTMTGEPRASEVDAVYVGWHPQCTMKDIEAACQAIWAGAKLYVASDVPFFATKQGRAMGYSYAIVGAIRRLTKAPFILTGKPSLYALRFAARRLGIPVRTLGVIGDDPGVEIIMARRGGATAFGVTTGVTKSEDWARETGNRRPHRVLSEIRDLLECDALRVLVRAAPSQVSQSDQHDGS